MAAKKILVVEDNDDNREIFIHRLKRLGDYEILAACNGKEAVEIASKTRPDLIFMDLMMPVMDGWQATQALRQTDWGKDLPIIAVTAYTMEADKEKAMKAGCSDYIPKPITDYAILQKKIEIFLNKIPATAP